MTNLRLYFGIVGSVLLFSKSDAQSTFSVVKGLLETHCTVSCHNAQSNSGSMNLTGTESEVYNRIVNVNPTNPAAAQKGDKRIAPGYPNRSFLLRKCNNNLYAHDGLTSPSEGNAMPEGQPALSNSEIELIRQWVYFGAPMTGTVVSPAIIEEFYTNGGINSIPTPPPLPTEPGAFQLHLGKLFLAPQTEAEYFLKYDLRLPADVKIDRLEMIMAPQSHHFILYKFNEGEDAGFSEGLRLQNPLNGVGSSGASSTFINAWQISYDTHLPEGTAYYWPQSSVLDFNYHMRNYNTDSILAVEAYINVYTIPANSPEEIMYSTLVTNLGIFIPNDNQPHTFTRADFDNTLNNNLNIWQLTSHTHKYGIDYDLFKRNADGSEGEQLYEGFYDIDYIFNQGYYNFAHPPIRQFNPLVPINPRLGLIQKATYRNDGPVPVHFGLTTADEMMVYYMQFTIGDPIVPQAISEVTNPLNLKVFPNPVTDVLNLNFNLAGAEKLSLSMTDVSGRVVYSNTYSCSSGSSTLTITPPKLSSGLYFLSLTSTEGKSVTAVQMK